MMTSNLAVAALSAALKQNEYPLSYLSELLRFLEIKTGESKDLSIAQKESLKSIITALSQQTPVEYIVGEALFFGRRFQVTRDVLIPRFDTETLVEKGLEIVKNINEPISIIDIGTGCGSIIISLAKELDSQTNVEFVAIDISQEALAIAKQNAKIHQATEKIAFQCTDTFPKSADESPLLPIYSNVLIISNPPYISEENMKKLPDSVKNYEPVLALEVQEAFIPKLQAYIDFLRSKKMAIYCAFEYSNSRGEVIFRDATPLPGDLSALLLS